MGMAWHGHGMCELASTVQRRHVGDLPAFGFFRLSRGFASNFSKGKGFLSFPKPKHKISLSLPSTILLCVWG
jgi:hypothetical protein